MEKKVNKKWKIAAIVTSVVVLCLSVCAILGYVYEFSQMVYEERAYHLNETAAQINETVDVAIGDLDCEIKDNKYYPYEIINNYLPNIDDEGIFIYLIENDFCIDKEKISRKVYLP